MDTNRQGTIIQLLGHKFQFELQLLKDLAHIFDRHYQANGTRQQFAGSAGLGLSLVKWVAEAHGGHVSVTSTPNRGTIFSISLPSAEPAKTHHPGQKPIKQIATER